MSFIPATAAMFRWPVLMIVATPGVPGCPGAPGVPGVIAIAPGELVPPIVTSAGLMIRPFAR